jgi:hypothetical protein
MTLRKKTSIEDQKQAAEKSLSGRLELLQAKGWDAQRIQRDAKVKAFRAAVKLSKKRLGNIAAEEEMMVQKAQTKTQKLEALKSAPPQTKKKAAPVAGATKKAKKERKKVEQSDE